MEQRAPRVVRSYMKHALLLLFGLVVGCIPAMDDFHEPNRCVVERVDSASGRVAARFVFVDGRLVERRHFIGPGNVATMYLERNRSGRLVRTRWVRKASGREFDPWFSWRRNHVAYDEATVIQKQRTYRYDQRGNLTEQRTHKRTTRASGTVEWTMSKKYRYDELGRKVFRIVNSPGDRNEYGNRSYYDYEGGGLREIKRELGPDLTSHTTFERDDQGRVIRRHYTSNFESTYTFRYSARGRLVEKRSSSGYTVRYPRDDDGRLLGYPPRGEEFTYDENGRVSAAEFREGDGYDVTYSAGCPSGFTHPAVTPNLDYSLYYEGPLEYSLTLPTDERPVFLYH